MRVLNVVMLLFIALLFVAEANSVRSHSRVTKLFKKTGDGDDDSDAIDDNPTDFGEVGRVTWQTQSRDEKLTVSLARSYENPIVVGFRLTKNGDHDFVPAFHNIDSKSFQMTWNEWEYHDGPHPATEDLAYFAVDKGVHNLAYGVRIEAGVQSVGNDGARVIFAEEFCKTPIILASITGTTTAFVIREYNVDTAGFDVLIQRELAQEEQAIDEEIEINWIAISQGEHEGKWEAGIFDADHEATEVTWNSENGKEVFVNIQSIHDATPAIAKLNSYSFDDKKMSAWVREDRSTNAPEDHAAEKLGYVVITGFDTNLDTVEEGAYGDVGSFEWKTSAASDKMRISWDGEIDDAVVIVQRMTQNGPDAFIPTISDVSTKSFKLQFIEWRELDGHHPATEKISWIAVQSGYHRLTDGTHYEAGITRVTDSWSEVSFEQEFCDSPVVIAQMAGTDQPLAIRLKDVTASGFSILYQAEEALRGKDNGEVTVHWMAMKNGKHNDFQASTAHAHHEQKQVSFHMEEADAIFGRIQTTKGGDTAILEIDSYNFDSKTATMHIEEETSADSEKNHVSETIGYVVIKDAHAWREK